MHLKVSDNDPGRIIEKVGVTVTSTSVVLSDQRFWYNQICKHGSSSLYLALFPEDRSGMIDHGSQIYIVRPPS